MSQKTRLGNFFEDFSIGQKIAHATPRTITEGDVALYTALTGTRFACASADTFAHRLGFPRSPVDDVLAFNVVFGKTVPDISLNAIANLGYAAGRFGQPVYPGDTLTSDSTVIGLKENRDGKTGVVYVRSCGVNQRGEMVLDYCRWVMVRKKDTALPAPEAIVPELPAAVAARRADRSGGYPRRSVRLCAIRQHRPVGRLSGRRKDRSCGRHDHRRKRTHDGHPPVPEHRQGALQPACRKGRSFWPPHRLWRFRHQPGPLAVLQRAGQCLQAGRHQWWPSRFSGLCRPYGLRLVGSARKAGSAGTQRSWRIAAYVPWRPRTRPAPTFPTNLPTATTIRAFSSISTTRF